MNKKLLGVSIIVILIGMIMIGVKGYNVNVKYKAHKVVNVPINAEYNIDDINSIAKEVFGKQVQLEKAGLYGDVLFINTEEASDEQVSNLTQKLNEKYNTKQEILIPVNEDYNTADIEEIAKEVLKKDSVEVKKYEDDEKYASIEAGYITEKEAEDLVNKINEKYDLQNTTSSIQAQKTISVSNRGKEALKDMAKQYDNYVIIASIIIVVYFAVRFRKLGIISVVLKTLLSILLAELLYISIIAIVRYPVDKLAIMAAIAIYIFTVTYLNYLFMKKTEPEAKKEK